MAWVKIIEVSVGANEAACRAEVLQTSNSVMPVPSGLGPWNGTHQWSLPGPADVLRRVTEAIQLGPSRRPAG
jgi:hypothetical protein